MEALLRGLDLSVPCPIRSITLFRSEPSLRSHEACVCRRSCIRKLNAMPLAATAGSHTRVRRVLREMGVPAVVVKSSSSRLRSRVWMWRATFASHSSSTPKVRGLLSFG